MVRVWLRAVLRNWKKELLGGALIGALALISDLTGITVPPRIYELATVVLVFYAMYLAWRDEHQKVKQLEIDSPELIDRRRHTQALEELTREMRTQSLRAATDAKIPSGPIARLRIVYGNEPCVEVTNDGDAAEFWITFDIDGLVSGERSALFGRWAHTDSPKTRIVKAQTCRILLGKLDWDFRVQPWIAAQWHIYSTNERGPKDTPAVYTSMWGSEMGGEAPDVILYGSVFADPDLRNGPQLFCLVLKAGGSCDVPTEKKENV